MFKKETYRLEAFTETESDKMCPVDQPRQFGAKVQRFGHLLND